MEIFTMKNGRTIFILESEEDVGEDVLAEADEAVDWFDDEPSMPAEDFFDRMFKHSKYDLEEMDNPAAKKILRHARKLRRERRAPS